MSSINTNLSAMTALQSLKTTQTAMNKTQGQISTGLRVGEASHNASYWSIATSMKSDNGALGAVKDAIGQSKSMINTFTSAMDKTLTYLNKMKEGLVAASQPGADLAKIQTEFNANIEGMKSAANSASFNGQNWLQGAGKNVEIVTSYDGVNNKVNTLSVDTTKTSLFTDAEAGTGGLLADVAAIDIKDALPASIATVKGTKETTSGGGDGVGGYVDISIDDFSEGNKLTFSVGGTKTEYVLTAADVDAATLAGNLTAAGATITETGGVIRIQNDDTANGEGVTASFTGKVGIALEAIDEAIAKVTEGSAMLGASKALLETQEEFIGVLSDSLTAGVSTFIDADMNEASTRYQALQTQQQLGVQALSMANQNSQMILKLFQ